VKASQVTFHLSVWRWRPTLSESYVLRRTCPSGPATSAASLLLAHKSLVAHCTWIIIMWS